MCARTDKAGKDSDGKTVSVDCVWGAAGCPHPRETQLSCRTLHYWRARVYKEKPQGKKLEAISLKHPTLSDQWSCGHILYKPSSSGFVQDINIISVAYRELSYKISIFCLVWDTLLIIHLCGLVSCTSGVSDNFFVHVSFSLNLSHTTSFSVRWPIMDSFIVLF